MRSLERRLADAAKVVPTARVEELRDGGALFADIRTSLSLQEAKTHTTTCAGRCERPPGPSRSSPVSPRSSVTSIGSSPPTCGGAS